MIVFSFSKFLSNSVESRSRSRSIKRSCAIFWPVVVSFNFFFVAILANATVLIDSHDKIATGSNPVILWIELGGMPTWLPSKFGYHDS